MWAIGTAPAVVKAMGEWCIRANIRADIDRGAGNIEVIILQLASNSMEIKVICGRIKTLPHHSSKVRTTPPRGSYRTANTQHRPFDLL